jgi:putative salt-induced outer membrane protein YdiY
MMIALLFSFTLARADVMVLANGDRLTGKVIKRENGKIYFHSKILGDIIAPESAVTIEKSPPSSTSVNSLVGLPPPSAANPAKGPPKQPTVVKAPINPWSGKIEFGYENYVNNDIRTTNTTFRAQAERTSQEDDLLFKARFLYGLSSGQATTDQEDGEFRWRHNLSDRIFSQSDTTYDSDKIRQIDYEDQENAGLGYKILKGVSQTIDVGVGAVEQDLDAAGVEQGVNYFGSFFQDYTYKISGRYTLTEDLSAQYSPEERSRYGFVADSTVPLTGSERDYEYKFHTTLQGKINKHLSLNLHFEYEFDNAILDPNARGSQRISTSLGYGF